MKKELPPALKKWFKLSEKISKFHREILKEVGTEQSLTRIARKEVEARGYKAYSEYETSYGRIDIFAEKDNEQLIVEVKGTNNMLANQLIRYERGLIHNPLGKKLILVLPIWDGKNVEVWGLQQLLNGLGLEKIELLEKMIKDLKGISNGH